MGRFRTIQEGGESRALARKANQRDSHGGAIDDPRFVRPSVEDSAILNDPVDNHSIVSASDRVRCHEAGSVYLSLGYELACLVEPIADKISGRGNQTPIEAPQIVGIAVPQNAPRNPIS